MDLNETIEITIGNGDQDQPSQSEESEDDYVKLSAMDTLPMPNKDALASSAIAPAAASDAAPAVLVPMEIQANKNESARRSSKVIEVEEQSSPPATAKINKIDQMESSEVALLEPHALLEPPAAGASVNEDQSENAAQDVVTNRDDNATPNREETGNLQQIELDVNNNEKESLLPQKPKSKS